MSELKDQASDEDDETSRAALDEQLEELKRVHAELHQQIQSHARDTNYAHYCQLRMGLIEFLDALDKFLRPSSKKPHGPLEFLFNKAIGTFGGNYMPDHGGLEQTNGIALNSLEQFDQVAIICRGAYPESHDLHTQIDGMFTQFQKLAKSTLELMRLMKSQKKLSPRVFLDTLIDFIIDWQKTFPDTSVFNKLHLLLIHYADHVDMFEMCGRVSGEAHESVHAQLAILRKSYCNMSSYQQQNKTFWARAFATLKSGVAESKAQYTKLATGTKRGNYDLTEKKSKLLDQSEFSVSIFDNLPETVDGEDFLLLSRGGRIPSDYKDDFVYVRHGRAQEKWMEQFRNSGRLSNAKVEAAKYA